RGRRPPRSRSSPSDLATAAGRGTAARGGELLLFASNHLLDLCLAETERADHDLVEDSHAAAGDRAHGELLLARDAELADDEDIERERQRARDLIGDRDATTRKAQDNRVVPVRIG